MKAANFLPDEEFEAVVGYFGLATIIKTRAVRGTIRAVRGTIGHIEYQKIFKENRCLWLRIMLLELITVQRAFDLARLANDDDVMLLDWVLIIC